MKKFYFLTCLFVGFSVTNFVQAQVSKAPQFKNFLIEKGTGQVCGSCPDIAKKCDTVIESHPGRGMLIEYHFGPDAKPQAGALAQDFRTWYGDTIYDPNGLKWPFYLNMMVNRLDRGAPYGSTFIFGPNNNQVQPEADRLVLESSPVNLYMSPSYNANTRELTIQAEVYYTENALSNTNFLQIAITEDSIISTQYDPLNYTQNNGFNPKFNHTNVFRDNINGFAGDTIATTTKGTLISRTYRYTFPDKYRNISCDPTHCKLTMYIADMKNASGKQSFTGNITTAIRTDIFGKNFTGIHDFENTSNVTIYPNPSNGIYQLQSLSDQIYRIDVYNSNGQLIKQIQTNQANNCIDISNQSNGIYLFNVFSKQGKNTYKVLKTE